MMVLIYFLFLQTIVFCFFIYCVFFLLFVFQQLEVSYVVRSDVQRNSISVQS
jgi:hypothetical protein